MVGSHYSLTLALVALLLTSITAFVLTTSSSSRSTRKILHASDPTSQDIETNVQDEHRRNLLLSSAVAMIGASSALLNNDSSISIFSQQVSKSMASKQLVVDQALETIENQCDRRFLHAVVASNYHFLYQKAPLDNQVCILQTKMDTSVLKSSTLTSGDLKVIDTKLKDRPMKVGASCQLAFANPKDISCDDESVVSVWPLGGNVHFSWMEQKTAFTSIGADDRIIVDGIDCGRMSLEDALEEGKQVLFQSETFLAVPQSLEKELVAKLQGAFLI